MIRNNGVFSKVYYSNIKDKPVMLCKKYHLKLLYHKRVSKTVIAYLVLLSYLDLISINSHKSQLENVFNIGNECHSSAKKFNKMYQLSTACLVF